MVCDLQLGATMVGGLGDLTTFDCDKEASRVDDFPTDSGLDKSPPRLACQPPNEPFRLIQPTHLAIKTTPP